MWKNMKGIFGNSLSKFIDWGDATWHKWILLLERRYIILWINNFTKKNKFSTMHTYIFRSITKSFPVGYIWNSSLDPLNLLSNT